MITINDTETAFISTVTGEVIPFTIQSDNSIMLDFEDMQICLSSFDLAFDLLSTIEKSEIKYKSDKANLAEGKLIADKR